MTLTNIKIGTRLAIGFATLLVLLLALGAAALWQMSRVYEGTLELGNNWLPSVQAAGNMQAYVNNVRRTALLALLANGPQEFQAQRAAHNEAITMLTPNWPITRSWFLRQRSSRSTINSKALGQPTAERIQKSSTS
ncbi:hypothetical protein BZM26_37105 [Paraburkholderia strydomiana]|nr:hypothetical protein BZM26_37105 [Paraburkholderia strydomiana]